MARKRFTSEIRDVAKGWRWGRRTMTPALGPGFDAAAEDLELPDRLGSDRGRPTWLGT